MPSQKVPRPKDIKAAAQEAADAAQSVAAGALRIPPATVKLAAEVPELIENLAIATERLNAAIDRAERYLALAAPMIRTMDALLPQLEALVATGNDVYRTVASVPGVSTLGRFASRGSEEPAEPKPSKRRSPKPKS
jgi:ABC-type transporter Mla subunit MlaD